MARWRAVLGSTLVVVSASATIPPLPTVAAGAAGTHRAMVIVDTGAATYQRVVTFSSDSITGIQALDLAGANPVVYSYAGQGGAVCRLFGVGRDAGPNCLGGSDGDNRYWAYFRAPSGTSSFTYSRAGAGSVQVRDGDVEGWKFSTGQGPAWSPIPVDPATTTTTAGTAPPTGGSGGPVSPSSASSAAPGNGPAAAAGATPSAADLLRIAALLEAASTTTTSTPPTTTKARSAEVKGASTRRGTAAARAGTDVVDDGTDWPVSLIAFGAAIVAILGVGLYVRRTRHRPIP